MLCGCSWWLRSRWGSAQTYTGSRRVSRLGKLTGLLKWADFCKVDPSEVTVKLFLRRSSCMHHSHTEMHVGHYSWSLIVLAASGEPSDLWAGCKLPCLRAETRPAAWVALMQLKCQCYITCSYQSTLSVLVIQMLWNRDLKHDLF